MTAYFVMGIITVAWALILAAVGLTRESFPPSGTGLRAIIAVSVLLVVGTLVALLATTKKEHPRQEAAKKSAEQSAKGGGGTEQPSSQKKQAAPTGAGAIGASEKEFSITLAGGDSIKSGRYTIETANKGTIQHDLAVEGGGIKKTKTPLLDPGKSAKLSVDLKPGKYTLYCTVPGHEQAGMKVDLTVE